MYDEVKLLVFKYPSTLSKDTLHHSSLGNSKSLTSKLSFISATSFEESSADSFNLVVVAKYIVSPRWTLCFAKNSEVPKSINFGIGFTRFSLLNIISSTKVPFSYVFTTVTLSFPRTPSWVTISSPLGNVALLL